MARLAIAGIGGRMGQSIYHCLMAPDSVAAGNNSRDDWDAGLRLTVATAKPGDKCIGQLLSQTCPPLGDGAGDVGHDMAVTITSSLSLDFDVLIDFTSVSASMTHLAFCREQQKAIVIGTTGFNASQIDTIRDAAKDIPVFMSANMSMGVNLMNALAAQATHALINQMQVTADIEMVEAHHRHKVDAPSGTALMIGETVAATLGKALPDIAVKSRDGLIGPRESGTIGFSTIRGGDVVGEHTLTFYMAGERFEISHRATDRSIFARGALFAANAISKKSAGFYTMRDLLGFN
ncbi:4-hydroxy-tetrahydrodipicolinate reductase [Ostreibacterium oceani]|uniref:4-hydroxy-tetrahydrodipicolinate reductase n=1 Tax=Ostreibacterium oceani TaxID=2654998 RepID=A0A6N7EYC6_9GAMM|nr:4-hydroxy-tetrahydrodipicolinate reductase [Ostreibacterium oceani]MPV86560.1 4-hydroxy-tetrahydrodipicolinate reductase [Ostreibacterium oceani]